jgi:dTDP-4-amino-4,6-dideoxygalactose transaminase
MTATRVPFVDLGPAHAELKDEILADVSRLVDSGAFTNGPEVTAFELAFADYCGRSGCVGLASGLDALRLGLIAAGLEPGEEVIVPAATFVATYEAVTQAGGIPVPVDVTEADYNLDPAAADAAVTSRTRVLLPVHLYGQLADLQALHRVAERHDLGILEDACQAHGAGRDGLRPGDGSLGAAFSFYPTKNLGAMGDAGALVSDDADLCAAVRALREHGQQAKYEHAVPGYTARLDTIQALVLLRKLPLLDGWNGERRAAAAFYSDSLAELGDIRIPPVPSGSDPVWHLYVIRTSDPRGLAEFLEERGISVGKHYPEPVPLTQAYRYLGRAAGAFPVAEQLSAECLSLPLYPGISEPQLQTVVDAVTDYFRRG